jgi:hypothetical protein
MRKTNLERLSAHRPEGVFVIPFERGEIGPDLFRAACQMGLQGLPQASNRPPPIAPFWECGNSTAIFEIIDGFAKVTRQRSRMGGSRCPNQLRLANG